jgi:hypothetical protein
VRAEARYHADDYVVFFQAQDLSGGLAVRFCRYRSYTNSVWNDLHITDFLALTRDFSGALRKRDDCVSSAVQYFGGSTLQSWKFSGAVVLSVNDDWRFFEHRRCSTPKSPDVKMGVDDIRRSLAHKPPHLFEIMNS